MTDHLSSLSRFLQSPLRILAIVLAVIFTVEFSIMIALPYMFPEKLKDPFRATVDAILLTVISAPILWWVIIRPLRQIALQEHARSETIVSNAGEGIMTFNHRGVIESINRTAADLFLRTPEELLGKQLRTFFRDSLPVLDSTLKEHRIDGVQAGGSIVPLSITVTDFPSGDNKLYIALIRDLTEAQRSEAERINNARETEALRAQQMKTLAELATGVAHEVRNPLTSIKMLIQVNRVKLAKTGVPAEDLELVEHEIRRMERSVNSLLEYARPVEAELREFALQDAIATVVQLTQGRCAKANVTVHLTAPNDPVLIYGDKPQIQQLLLNLTLNALDAMPAGGEIRYTVAIRESDVQLLVEDTGHGIAPEVLGKLFSPFVTTKPQGVGLGLGICRRIAEMHHGTLSGTNLADGGAQFGLFLPRTACQSAES